MRILYITTKADYGGVQTHILQCSRYMKDLGHEVAVMAHPGGRLEQTLQEMSVPFYPNPFLKNAYNPFLGLSAMRAVRKAVGEFKPDIVSLHSSAAGFWGRLAIRGSIPTVFTAHGWAFTSGSPMGRRQLALLAEKLTAPFARAIICVSEFDRDLALAYQIAPSEKLHAIHNGVELFPVLEKQDKKDLGIVPVIYVGRLSGQKDPELLLQAFSALSPVVLSKAHLYFIGDGEKRQALESQIAGHSLVQSVSLLGEMSRAEVLKVLEKFARSGATPIFALISNQEGLPRSILEAMSFGYAVVATDAGGVKEELAEGAGILVQPHDLSRLKGVLEKLLESEEERAALAKCARLRIEKEFMLSTMLRKTETVYLSVLKQ